MEAEYSTMEPETVKSIRMIMAQRKFFRRLTTKEKFGVSQLQLMVTTLPQEMTITSSPGANKRMVFLQAVSSQMKQEKQREVVLQPSANSQILSAQEP